MTAASKTRPTTGRRFRERQARIALILEAGARIFSRHSVEAATMEMVATEAELGKATIYYYFATKQELYAEIVRAAAQELVHLVKEEELATAPPKAATGKLCRVLLRYFERHPDLAALHLPAMAQGPEHLAKKLGKKIAREIALAHGPIFAALAPFGSKLAAGHVLPDLVASMLLGLATKLQHGGTPEVRAEIELFFELLTLAGDRTPKKRK